MAARETKAQKSARVSALLAEYDNATRAKNKYDTIAKGLAAQIRDLDAGEYGDWMLTYGTPRMITDMPAVQADYQARGVEMPKKQTQPPIVVSPKAGR